MKGKPEDLEPAQSYAIVNIITAIGQLLSYSSVFTSKHVHFLCNKNYNKP